MARRSEKDWDILLPFSVAAYNNRVNNSLGYSEFYALLGHHPNTEFAISPNMSNITAENYLISTQFVKERKIPSTSQIINRSNELILDSENRLSRLDSKYSSP